MSANNFEIRLRAIALWAEGKTVAEIAQVCGVSKGKVSGVMNRHRKFFPPRKAGRAVDNRRGQEQERVR